MNIELVGSHNVVGEGPHWDEREQVLYYVDIPSSLVKKYDPRTRTETCVKIEGADVSFVVPVEGQVNSFLIGYGRSLSLLKWNGTNNDHVEVKHISTVDTEEDKIQNRLNDGKVDPTGVLWAGTMAPETSPGVVEPGRGSLYSFSAQGKPKKHLSDITVSNGLAWSKDLKTMYYIDSFAYCVDALDYDSSTGKISNRRVVFDFKSEGISGFPDGMTIDTDDNLWVACYNGAQVIKINPSTGELLSRILVPALETTSVTFGGKNLDELFITSASKNISEADLLNYPYAGYTFHVTEVGAKGYPGLNAELSIGENIA